MIDFQHAVLMDTDPQQARTALADSVLGPAGRQVATRREDNLYFDLRRNEQVPYSVHTEKGLEALAFPGLYPTGDQHFGEFHSACYSLARVRLFGVIEVRVSHRNLPEEESSLRNVLSTTHLECGQALPESDVHWVGNHDLAIPPSKRSCKSCHATV
jgi:hypothetical protein